MSRKHLRRCSHVKVFDMGQAANQNRLVQMLKGLPYNFEDLPVEFHSDELNLLKNLQDRKSRLLKRIADWEDCPESYRSKLYKRLQAMDVSRKAVTSTLDEIIREMGVVEFDLQLNPSWVRGLLKQVDEIIDQTKRAERGAFITELIHIKEDFGLLKNACNRYYLMK